MIKRAIIATMLLCANVWAQDEEWAFGIGQKDQVTRGLVSYWSMRNSGTTVYDEIGSNPGTAINSPTFAYTNGVVGNGAGFVAASSQSIRFADDSFDALNEGAISIWVYPIAGHASIYSLLSYGDSASTAYYALLYINTDGSLRFQLRRADQNNQVISEVAAGVITYGAWNHVVLCSNTATYTWYVNGVERSKTTTPVGAGLDGDWFYDISVQTELAAIGVFRRSSDSGYMGGKLDEARIYNSCPTSDEVKQLYRMGAVIFQNR